MRIHLIAALCVLTLGAAHAEDAAPPTPPGDGAKPGAADRRSRHDRDPAAALARLDTDHDRTLSAAEVAAVRSQRYRERLLAFDLDKDLDLDAAEFAAASAPKPAGGADPAAPGKDDPGAE